MLDFIYNLSIPEDHCVHCLDGDTASELKCIGLFVDVWVYRTATGVNFINGSRRPVLEIYKMEDIILVPAYATAGNRQLLKTYS